jgi:hypothetical protein
MKTIFVTGLFLSIMVFASCHKEKLYVPVKPCSDLTSNIDTVSMYLKGKWNWMQEQRYDRVDQDYKYLTPRTEGYTLTLEIEGDTVTFYKNSKFYDASKFKILKESDITNIQTDTDTVLAFYNLSSGFIQNYVPIKICSSFLVLQFQLTSSVVGEQIWKRI